MSTPEQAEKPSKPRLEPLLQRATGVPGLFVAVYSAVGFSIYFSLGVVADRGLGLTPLIFLAAGLLFVVTTLRNEDNYRIVSARKATRHEQDRYYAGDLETW